MIFWCIQPTCLDPSSLICDIVLVVISCSLSVLLKSLLRYTTSSLLFFIISVTVLLLLFATVILQFCSLIVLSQFYVFCLLSLNEKLHK